MKKAPGFTLIEVLVALSVLGLTSVALFSLLSGSLRNLRKLQDIHHYQLACEEIMNRIQLLTTLPPQGNASGRISDLASDWTVSVTPWYPVSLNTKPAQAIMRIAVDMSWIARGEQRSLHMESLKPSTITYVNYDFNQAIDKAAPR